MVSNTETIMPVTFIHGEYPGKTVLTTSGIHPAESTGIQTSIQLAKELSSQQRNWKIDYYPFN